MQDAEVFDGIMLDFNNDWDILSVENYTSIFKKSTVKRTKYKGLKRNINKLF